MAKVINPEDEILWHKIREAVDRVVFNPEQSITLEIAGRKIEITAGTKYTTIVLSEVEPVQPTLIVPPEN